ncbi:pitrilysin family protein [Opitutus sp. ER46]|uniref:M16 family metallopeptidase n=1 Tax=Opitutus sp. ER46 TaxID=2161864 RepID=UPI000D31D9E9|nr:pitrilysin family protein [Opitutus sp. ER46]PTX98582.1 insulinase family protein [Opitutus sp. ER46]
MNALIASLRRALPALLLTCTLPVLAPLHAAPAAATTTKDAVLLPVPNDPSVSFRLWFKVGAQDDPAGKEGLAALTAAMLTDAATRQNSYEQILDRLFPLAAGYSASPTMEMTVIHGRTHKDNLEEFYPLFVDAVLNPAFKPEDLDRIKSRTLNLLETTLRFASDEELGKAVLYQEIFAGTPYGHLPAGTVAALKSITVDDIKAFYTQHYTRDNVVIGLGGGYAPALVDRLRADLAKLPAGAPAVVPAPQPKPISGLRVTLVEKDATATALSLGFPIDVLRGSKDWYALAIANSWLGEHRNSGSHLYQVIRETRGLNYGDYSYIEHFPNGGQRFLPPQNVARRQQIFEIWIRPVPNEARHFALRAALREFRQLVDGGMSAADFETRREFLKKYVVHYATNTNERLGYAIDDAFYGLKESHLATFRRMMDELTVADVNAAMKRHWRYENMQIVAVTPKAAAFADALVADAPSPITYSSPKPDAVLTEDKVISTYPLKISRENIRIVPVTELFAK